MTSRVRRILYVLLFALICGLGDGPFVDEFEAMAEGQQEAQLTMQRDRAPADQSGALMVVYATLMSAADVSSFPSVALGGTTQPLPIYTAHVYGGPHPAPPAKPPRSSLA